MTHFGRAGSMRALIREAALLAAVIKSRSPYSPVKHHDRALLRRNEVIDEMIATAMLRSADSASAEASPLGVAAKT